ncbi:complex I subunit 4 family protein [Ilumatobacter sp.]|uniref:complex I subunit 4 family protein n=1 Tax=Ilumatobacter sp. TaxID=1967498 RepID=UPI003B52BC09
MNNLTDSNWLLSLGTFLPIAGALAIMFGTARDDERSPKIVGIVTAGATLVIGIVTLLRFDYGRSADLQFFVDVDWIPVISSGYTVGLDGISLPLYFLSMVVTFLVMIYSWDNMPDVGNAKAFYSLMLILQTGMAGTFIAQDLILFFVFFEVVLLPMYFMIGVWGGEQRKYASLKFFLYTMFGSAFMLVAFLALFFQTGGESFGFAQLVEAGAGIDRNVQIWIFAGMFLGFAVKVPMFPFHTWLPDAHTQAPTQGSVILAAILLKLGTYGFVRIALPMLPQGAEAWAPVIGILAVIGIIYGALGCLAQTDMKRLIAFSSVAHMGFVMLGISTLTTFGINAALFGMVSHGLITGILFFVAGSVKHRYHTLEIKRLSGMLIQMPRMGWILGFAAMASLGLPGLAGFWGEFPAILSAYQPHPALSEPLFRTLMVVAAVGTVLAAAYLLWLYQRTAFGEPGAEFAGHSDAERAAARGSGHGVAHSLSSAANADARTAHDTHDTHEAHEDIHDVQPTEWIAWTPFLVAIVVFGVYPDLLFRVLDPAVTQLVETISAGIPT